MIAGAVSGSHEPAPLPPGTSCADTARRPAMPLAPPRRGSPGAAGRCTRGPPNTSRPARRAHRSPGQDPLGGVPLPARRDQVLPQDSRRSPPLIQARDPGRTPPAPSRPHRLRRQRRRDRPAAHPAPGRQSPAGQPLDPGAVADRRVQPRCSEPRTGWTTPLRADTAPLRAGQGRSCPRHRTGGGTASHRTDAAGPSEAPGGGSPAGCSG